MKNPSKIYLHIGHDKTGTSAIQGMADDNRALLASYGILYPAGRWHGQLASYFSTDKLKFVYNVHSGREDVRAIEQADCLYQDQIAQELEASECEIAVLSYEGFPALTDAELLKLRGFLELFSTDIYVLAYCRHPLSYAVSALSQRARMGLPMPSDPAGVRHHLVPRYQHLFNGFRRVFGAERMKIREFSRTKLYRNDVRADFLRALGCPDQMIDAIQMNSGQPNASLSAEAVLIGRAIAARMGSRNSVPVFFNRYDRLLGAIRGASIRLSEADRDVILEASASGLSYLKNVYDIDLEEPAIASPAHEIVLFGSETISSIANVFLGLVELNEEIVGMCGRDIVTQAYRWLLGRDPESDHVTASHLAACAGDWRALRDSVMQSPEFQAKVPRR